jgi:hypothetical protein
MVGDIIFVDLDHRPPRPLFVVKFRLSANGDDTGVIRGNCDEAIQRVWRDGLGKVSTSLGAWDQAHSIRVHHKDVLVKGRVNANDVSHLVIDFELQRVHGSIEVDPVEIMQEQYLRITLATIARALTFARLSDLDDDHIARES